MTTSTLPVNQDFDTKTAALLVQTASKFNSHITLQIDNKTANAKSIMGIISLGLTAGQQITVAAEGDDEEYVIALLENFFNPKQY